MPRNTGPKRPPKPPDHRITVWAKAVTAGKVVSGPLIRAACARHLDDLEHAGARGFYFDPAAADHFIDFCSDVLHVEVDGENVAFHLLDWQAFTGGCLFGWKRTDTGYRRFTMAYVEAGKGSGKTPFAAAIGLYMLKADGEYGAEVYAAAANKEQARITFDDAVKMVDASPFLFDRLNQAGQNPVWQLSHRPTQSKFRPIASAKSRSGFRVHCAIIDELHEHKTDYVLEMMRKGTKKRNQPLIFIITNSGFDRKSVCYRYHENGTKVVNRIREDDRFFVMIFSLDPDDDPLEDEGCWPKTNPGIGTTVTLEYLREQVADARAVPGQESLCLRLNFCKWTDAAAPWVTRKTWSACEGDIVRFENGAAVDDNPFAGSRLVLGLDLSSSFDLTAMAFCFPEAEGRFAMWIEYFTPMETVGEREHRDGTPYNAWLQQGLIHGVPGPHIREEFIARRLAEVKQVYDLELVAYDRYQHKSLARKCQEMGVEVPWMEHPQGFRRGGVWTDPLTLEPVIDLETRKPMDNPLWMPESVKMFEAALLEKTMEVQVSPITRWGVSSTVIRQDPSGVGNRIFSKRDSLGKIDGIVAAAMAIGALEVRRPSKPDIRLFLDNPVMV